MIKISGKFITLRLVNLKDAEFILNLRAKKGEFLSKSNIDLSEQNEWLKKYKKREEGDLEYYFIIENKEQIAVGTIRIYDIDHENKKFTFGSFIVDANFAHKYSALEAITLIFDLAFDKMNLVKCFFDCRKDNEHANKFYSRFGAKLINKDSINLYYEYSSELFQENRDKYLKIFKNHDSFFRSKKN